MKQKYIVSATVKFDVEIEVEADSETEAKEMGIKDIKSFYHLDCFGAPHDPKDVEVKVFYVELEE